MRAKEEWAMSEGPEQIGETPPWRLQLCPKHEAGIE